MINWGYITQQGIACAITVVVASAWFLALRALPALRRRPALRLWVELPLVAVFLWFLGRGSRRLEWIDWLPGRRLPVFVAIGLLYYWLAVVWPLRVLCSRQALRGIRSARLLAGTAVVLVLGAAWSTFVEPFWLDAERRTLVLEDVRGRPIRVAHISDTQLIAFGPRERALIERVNEFAPHIIVFTGDYITAHLDEAPAIAAMRHILANLRASHGIYATTSDSDSERQRLAIFRGLGVQYLLNRSATVEVEGTPVRIGGLNHFSPRWARTRGTAHDDELFLFACHTPDHAEDSCRHVPELDVYLCGHTHGGQVQIPWFGPIMTMTRSTSREIAAGGVFATSTGAPLLITRGVGTEGNYAPRVRFNCRPHLFLLTLEPTTRQFRDNSAR